MILYRYGKNEAGQVIDILTIKKSDKGKHICIGCDEELIPKIGEEREHHFAHKNKQAECSKETYLHNLAKICFFDTFQYCIKENIPFYIEVTKNLICRYKKCIFTKYEQFNLLEYFNTINMETKNEGFIPDLTLSNKDNAQKIFVSHQVTNKKIGSKNRIIEIKIENEDDINIILAKNLSMTNKKVNFINFNPSTGLFDNCANSECEEEFFYLALTPEGQLIYECKKILDYPIIKKRFVKLTVVDSKEKNYDNEYKTFVNECIRENNGIKNCRLCKYYFKSNYSFFPIFCQKQNITCREEDAYRCVYYDKIYDKY